MPFSWFGGHVDVPRMLEGGMGAQYFGLVSLPYLDRDLEGICHRQIDLLEKAAAESQGKLRLVATAREAEVAPREGAVAALLGIEGAHALGGRLEALDRFAARGVRYLGLVHFTANECGAPAFGKGADRTRGLTDFGRDVIARCEELGVIVDLAHLNRRGFLEACERAEKPMFVSHTGVAGVHSMWRNIDDEQLRAVAEKGGAIGIIFCPQYLGRDGIDAVVDHLLYVIDVAGEDAPALGSDWDGFIRPTRGLDQAQKLPDLTDALLRRGVSPRVIKKILRTNAMRVLWEVAPD